MNMAREAVISAENVQIKCFTAAVRICDRDGQTGPGSVRSRAISHRQGEVPAWLRVMLMMQLTRREQYTSYSFIEVNAPRNI